MWPANGIVEEGANCFNPPPIPLGVVIPEAGLHRTEFPSMILPVHTHMYVQYSTVQYNMYVHVDTYIEYIHLYCCFPNGGPRHHQESLALF